MMNNFNTSVALIAVVISHIGCRAKAPDDMSRLAQLTPTDMTMACDKLPERKEKIREKYSHHLHASSPSIRSGIEDMLDQLALLPMAYLEYMFNEHNIKINLIPRSPQNDDRNAGVTELEGYSYFDKEKEILTWERAWPLEIWVKPMRQGFLALLHETGHASIPFLASIHPDFQNKTADAYRDAVALERHKMNRYAASNFEEWAADTWDSYYCGEDSRAAMATRTPLALEFAEEYFIPAAAIMNGW